MGNHSKMEGLDSMDEQTFASWKQKPWKCDFKSAMERELDSMRDSLTTDQLAKLNTVITNVPTHPTPWGIVERIHERMTKKDGSTDGLNESMMNLSTAAAVDEPEAMATCDDEPPTQEQLSPGAQAPKTSFSNEPAEMAQPMASVSIEQLLPWTRYMTRIARIQASNGAKYFEVTEITYQPMFKITIRDSDSIKVYKFNALDSRLQRTKVLCESGAEAGCSCLLTVKNVGSEVLDEADLTKHPSRRIRATIMASENWRVTGIMFGHTGKCGPTVMSGDTNEEKLMCVRRTARSTIKTEYNIGRTTIKQEPMYF